ncbi:MAG: 1-acyl-sn-glycerol-3-phosphate acyltransferase [Saprospiraceae bacterium]|nr:1-acyl-sn-glycerol-3-phosphate acyltransferase [Saprospiraceae bacterium]
MSKRNKYYPTKYYIRILTFLVFSFFVRYYRIRAKVPRPVKKLKPPYLLLSNHVGYWDPFLIGHFLPHFVHFVSSDAAFKTKIAGFFLPRLGVIPKRKNVRDTQVIRDIIQVIGQGENVGIFPEAVRNWAGTTLPIDPSIAKLVRLLNVPVVVALSRGMNLFNPRWSKNVRKTKVEIEYGLLLDLEDLKNLSVEEIFKRIVSALQYDEVKAQLANKEVIYSKRKAEHINYAVYVCPECEAIGSFTVSENDFWCLNCDYHLSIDDYGFFRLSGTGFMHYSNIRDWYNWQEKWMFDYVENLYNENSTEIIFVDRSSQIFHSADNGKLLWIGRADILLYLDRIELIFLDREHTITLDIGSLQTINPQVNEKLEIFYRNETYRCVGAKPGVSGLKWEVAVNAIWKITGQTTKLSPYIKQ